ncbi:hypothetical protein I6F53_11210 [Pseudoalteromonas sp. SWN29]|uniref:hypothetical protein n=1 Tax=Pseudoalteromonas sp. SWN29 TaxID=2792064 RepID=UPI0018CDDAF9|nr:hypothetical protein [Pseudoalteromonas sp. SWN29]MBH0027553.1 hypothetical protein [Pseudoalteromonas sp. SWN29]
MTEQEKPRLITFKVDMTTFLALCAALYLAYSSHKANLKNTEKLSALLVKYEQTLDNAIKSDKATLQNYQENVRKAMSSLSPKEREFMDTLLSLDNGAD